MQGRHLGFGLYDIDEILFVVVGQADGVPLGQAGVASQRAFQHGPGIADVQKVLRKTVSMSDHHSQQGFCSHTCKLTI